MTDTEDEGRVVTPLRLLSSLRARIDEYARRRGLSLNAAASILLDEGLLAEERRRGPADDTPRKRK